MTSVFAALLDEARTDVRVAVRDSNNALSFRDMAAAADAVAAELRRAGVASGDCVVWESPAQASAVDLIALLGVSLVGAAFCSWPAGTDHGEVARQLPVTACLSAVDGRVRIEGVPPSIDGPAPGSAAFEYVLGTSGSTGAPKLVGITAANLTSLVQGFALQPRFSAGWRLAQVYHSYFDPYYSNVLQCLISRCCLVHVPTTSLLRLGKALRTHDIQALDCVPSMVRHAMRLRQFQPEDLTALRVLVMGGETLFTELAEHLLRVAPAALMVNAYGPTEATITATEFEFGAGWSSAEPSVPIGRPLPGIELGLASRAEGTELVLFGPQVISGYVDPTLDGGRFLDAADVEPFETPVRRGRGFATSDLVADVRGQLHVIGRADDQVKIRGRRVDLAEVSATMREATGGRESWVGLMDGRLVAVVEGNGLDESVLATLRDYARPEVTVCVPTLPRRGASKLDVSAIRTLVAERIRPATQPGGENSLS